LRRFTQQMLTEPIDPEPELEIWAEMIDLRSVASFFLKEVYLVWFKIFFFLSREPIGTAIFECAFGAIIKRLSFFHAAALGLSSLDVIIAFWHIPWPLHNAYIWIGGEAIVDRSRSGAFLSLQYFIMRNHQKSNLELVNQRKIFFFFFFHPP
jgi:hypothetical protein